MEQLLKSFVEGRVAREAAVSVLFSDKRCARMLQYNV
jgi:hypothetical protein